MPTIELPRETWVDRLNAFTMAHEGWMYTWRSAFARNRYPSVYS